MEKTKEEKRGQFQRLEGEIAEDCTNDFGQLSASADSEF